jgi:hypothetical protein
MHGAIFCAAPVCGGFDHKPDSPVMDKFAPMPPKACPFVLEHVV